MSKLQGYEGEPSYKTHTNGEITNIQKLHLILKQNDLKMTAKFIYDAFDSPSKVILITFESGWLINNNYKVVLFLFIYLFIYLYIYIYIYLFFFIFFIFNSYGFRLRFVLSVCKFHYL